MLTNRIDCLIDKELNDKINQEVLERQRINRDHKKSQTIRNALRFYFNAKETGLANGD
jgi:hypothetical protein